MCVLGYLCIPTSIQDRLQSVLNAAARVVSSRRTSDGQNTHLHRYGSFTGYASRNESSSGCVFWRTIVCMAQHVPAYLSDSLRPTSEIVGRRCLRSADTTTLGPTSAIPSTRRATLGDRPFPVAAACAWNSLPLETCSSLLTFRRETMQVSPFSSVIRLTWRRL